MAPSLYLYKIKKCFNLFQSFPDDAIGQSFEFERALCDLIILMSPFAPMFASELWRRVVNVQHMCTHYKRVRFWQCWCFFIPFFSVVDCSGWGTRATPRKFRSHHGIFFSGGERKNVISIFRIKMYWSKTGQWSILITEWISNFRSVKININIWEKLKLSTFNFSQKWLLVCIKELLEKLW